MDKNIKNDKYSFSTRRFKNGAYSTLLIAAAIVIVLLVNLIVSRMGIVLDISRQGLYTLSEDTDQIAENLKDDVTIYYIVTAGTEEQLIQNVVKNYDKYDKVSVESKDPVLYPTFTSQYTSEKVADNSVIVVNERTGVAKYIAFADLLELQMATDEETGEMYNKAVGVDAEGQITAALMYVTAEDLPILYAVTGHGEIEVNDVAMNEIGKLNMKVETLETIALEEIPEDCAVLLINGPSYDFSEDEATMIRKYLEDGGSAIILAGYTEEETPNLNSLLEYYGVEVERGVIVEEYGYYLGQYLTYLLPIQTSHEIAANVEKPIVSAVSQGLSAISSVRSSLSVEPILKTSSDAYLKLNPNSETFTQEMLDPDGPFVLGMAVTDTYQGVETKLVVLSTMNFLQTISTSQYGNSEVLVNAIDWATDLEASISIPTKSIEDVKLTMSSAEAGYWAAATTVGLPVLLLVAGFVIWYRRRRS